MARNAAVTVVCALVLVGAPAACWCETATKPSGKRANGQLLLQDGGWIFQDALGKSIPVKSLAHVLFDPKPQSLAHAPLYKTLLLPNRQALTGSLARVNDKSIEFTICTGESFRFSREQVTGAVHANDWRPLVFDDLSSPLQGWQIQGNTGSDAKTVFARTPSLRIAGAAELTRIWPALKAESRISLAVHSFAKDSGLRATITLLTEAKGKGSLPTFHLDARGWRYGDIGQASEPWQAPDGWHMLAIERQQDQLRLFADDFFLGQTTIAEEVGITGIRITTAATPVKHGQAELHLSHLQVAQRLPPLAMPAGNEQQDFVWLTHAEQIFGRIESVDSHGALLTGKLGKHVFPWSRLRGIGFARVKLAPSSDDPAIYLRPGLGFPADMLRGKLSRWEGRHLLVQHPTLGEIAIARDRLERICFHAQQPSTMSKRATSQCAR